MRDAIPTNRRAFTLVELLVVIGIVAVLVALLMPALGKVRKQALEVKCAANLRSIGQALTMYVQRSGYYPGCTGYGTRIAVIWPTRLRAFAGGDRSVFNCPARDEQFHWGEVEEGTVPVVAGPVESAWFGYEVGEPLLRVHGSYLTYGYNVGATGADGRGSAAGLGDHIFIDAENRNVFHVEVPGSWVKRPAEMIAIGDNTPDAFYDSMIAGGLLNSPFVWPGDVHRGGANILFCDGHVTWYPRKELIDFTGPQGPARRRMWHRDHEP